MTGESDAPEEDEEDDAEEAGGEGEGEGTRLELGEGCRERGMGIEEKGAKERGGDLRTSRNDPYERAVGG